MSDSESVPKGKKSGEEKASPDSFEWYVTKFQQVLWIAASIWLIVVVFTNLKTRILVEPVAMPKNLAEQGMTEEIAQQRLTADLMKVIDDASKTMPHEVQEEIEADGPEENIELESTGISLQAFIQYTKRMLGRHDVLIRSALVFTDDGLYTLKTTISNSTTTIVEAAPHPAANLEQAIDDGAALIIKAHIPFVYASALAAEERAVCYQHQVPCNYDEAIAAFKALLNDDTQRRFYKWSWLALSKIDEDEARYRDEVTKAMLSIKDDPTFYWGYYNWGIGLAGLDCDKEALEAFETAVFYNPMLDFAYNAAGREALGIARDEDPVANAKSHDDHLNRALDYLMTATAINGNYGEAYLNLGEAILELHDPREREHARSQFVAAMLRESSQAARAYMAMKEHGLALPGNSQDGPPLSTIKAIHDVYVQDAKCGNPTLAKSIRDANGCLSPNEELAFHSTDVKALGPPVYRVAARVPKRYCRALSVKENVGRLLPYQLNPVPANWPDSGDRPAMDGP
jgi:tetratricopeptide (TPR) repeat protein